MRRSVLTASMIAILALPLLLVIAGSGKESTLQPAEDIRNNPTSHRVRAALVDAFEYKLHREELESEGCVNLHVTAGGSNSVQGESVSDV